MESDPTPDAARESLLLDDCVLVKAEGTPPFDDSEAGGSFPKYDHIWHEEDGTVSPEVIFYSLQFHGTDVARVHAEPAPDYYGEAYPCGRLTGEVWEVYAIETDPPFARQGASTRLLELLTQELPGATWMAYSHNDGFWNQTGWKRYAHPDPENSSIYVWKPPSHSVTGDCPTAKTRPIQRRTSRKEQQCQIQ